MLFRSGYYGTFPIALPLLPFNQDQAVFEVVLYAQGNSGPTSKVIRITYSKRDVAVVNICKTFSNPFYGASFSVTADVINLTSTGISGVDVGLCKLGIPVTSYSNDVNSMK